MRKSHYEDSVLGNAILRGSLGLAASLRPSNFASALNAAIFEAMLDITERDERIELPAIQEALERLGNSRLIRLEYLIQLTDAPIANERTACEAMRKNAADNALRVKLAQAAREPDSGSALRIAISAADEYEHSSADGMTLAEAIEFAREEESRGIAGIPTGLAWDVDLADGGIRPGRMVVLAARPKCGKTAVSVSVAKGAAVSGAKVAFFTLELGHTELARRFEAAGIPRHLHDNVCIYDTLHDISDILAEMHQFRMLNRDHPCLCIIDYVGLIESREEASAIRSQQVSHIVRQLKRSCIRNEIGLLLLSQLNRESVKEAGSKPTVAHLRDSGSLEQDCDAAILMRREDGATIAELAIQRQGASGTEYSVQLSQGTVAGSRALTT